MLHTEGRVILRGVIVVLEAERQVVVVLVGVGALGYLGDVILVGLVGVVARPRDRVVGKGKVTTMRLPAVMVQMSVSGCSRRLRCVRSQVWVVVWIVWLWKKSDDSTLQLLLSFIITPS